MPEPIPRPLTVKEILQGIEALPRKQLGQLIAVLSMAKRGMLANLRELVANSSKALHQCQEQLEEEKDSKAKTEKLNDKLFSLLHKFNKVASDLTQNYDKKLSQHNELMQELDDLRAMKRRLEGKRLVIEGEEVLLDGNLVNLDLTAERRKDALLFLAQLTGDWQSRPEIAMKCPDLLGVRIDRIRKVLPVTLQEVIQSNRRKEYRLAPPTDIDSP